MLLVDKREEFAQDNSSSEAERRRGLRIPQKRPIKVFEPTLSRYFGGATADISATGLRIELPAATPLRNGKMVSVHVGLNDMGSALANRRQMIPARIVWIDRSNAAADGRVMAGVEFLATISAQMDAA